MYIADIYDNILLGTDFMDLTNPNQILDTEYWISKFQPDICLDIQTYCISKSQPYIGYPNSCQTLNIQIPAVYWIFKFQLDMQPDIQLDIEYPNST